MIDILNILGQIIFGGYFIYSGLNHFIHNKDYASYASSMKVPMPTFSVFFTGLLMLLGGIGILLNFYVDIAIVLLLIFLIPT
ncbi:MAG TPA: DoxX family membrane protein, partial [Candidatus Paceibacterota bacterium]